MTRLTPSDQADTGSAPGSAAIPPQRSAQSLRLLVLGSGDSAGALRSRAADAGAELAQRLSSRVTHVVVDDTVGEDDARVARARAAGLPVLDLAQGQNLLGAPEAGAAPGGVEADDAGGADIARGEAEALEDAEPVALTQPRPEPAAESASESAPTDDGSSNVFAGSALETVLLFPPPPADETVATCGCGESCNEDGPAAAGIDGGPGEEWGSAEEAHAYGIEGADPGVSEVDAGGSVAQELPPPAQPPVATAASVAWALVPLASLGLLTPVAMGYAAYRLRSRPLAAATAWYTAAVVAAFAVSAAAPQGGGTRNAVGDLLTACLATSWFGGTVHSFLIRRRVFG